MTAPQLLPYTLEEFLSAAGAVPDLAYVEFMGDTWWQNGSDRAITIATWMLLPVPVGSCETTDVVNLRAAPIISASRLGAMPRKQACVVWGKTKDTSGSGWWLISSSGGSSWGWANSNWLS